MSIDEETIEVFVIMIAILEEDTGMSITALYNWAIVHTGRSVCFLVLW